MSKPLTASERVARSREKALKEGARQVNVIIRGPAVLALDELTKKHGSKRAAIEMALVKFAHA